MAIRCYIAVTQDKRYWAGENDQNNAPTHRTVPCLSTNPILRRTIRYVTKPAKLSIQAAFIDLNIRFYSDSKESQNRSIYSRQLLESSIEALLKNK